MWARVGARWVANRLRAAALAYFLSMTISCPEEATLSIAPLSALLVLDEVEDLHDVLVVDLVDGARLLQEALHDAAIAGVLGAEDLDGDAAAEPDVLRLVHAAHRAFAQ